MIYIINNEIDENNRFYPNYYIDDSDKNNLRYYNMFLVEFTNKDFNKYGINNKQNGRGKKIIGGSVEDRADYQEVVKEQATRWKFIVDLLRCISFQPYGDKSQTDYKNKRTKLLSILLINDLRIKFGSKYYDFSKLSPFCRQEIADQALCNSKKKKRKALYNEFHAVNCLNFFCLRAAKFDKDVNQRQECPACDKYRTTPNSSRPLGWIFFFEERDLKGDTIVEIYASYKYVKASYTNMCHNNFNPTYWGPTKVKINGSTIKDVVPFTYIPKSSKEERLNNIKHSPEPVIIDGKPYECELMRQWNKYGKGLIEVDHKDGDHHNNTLSNIAPLCKICHGIKTDKQQDKSAGSGENFKIIARYDALFDGDQNQIDFINSLNNDVKGAIEVLTFIEKNGELEEFGDEILKIWDGPDIILKRFTKTDLNNQELKDQLKYEKNINMQLDLKKDIQQSAINAKLDDVANIGDDLVMDDVNDDDVNDDDDDDDDDDDEGDEEDDNGPIPDPVPGPIQASISAPLSDRQEKVKKKITELKALSMDALKKIARTYKIIVKENSRQDTLIKNIIKNSII